MKKLELEKSILITHRRNMMAAEEESLGSLTPRSDEESKNYNSITNRVQTNLVQRFKH